MDEQDLSRLAPYERTTRAWMSARGADLDAQATVHLLDRTCGDVIAALEGEALRPLGLSHARFVLLLTLLISGPRETRELANIMRVSRPAIVSVVDTLERTGLVRRRRCSEDRRLVSVRITKAGQELTEKAQQAWHEGEKAVASVLRPEEQRLLVDLLRRLDCGVYRSGRLAIPVAEAPTLWDPEAEDG